MSRRSDRSRTGSRDVRAGTHTRTGQRALSSRHSRRRGATMVETGMVLVVFLIIVFGLLDLGLAVFRYNIVSQGARHAARQAIVRGEMSSTFRDPWGPATYTGPVNGSDAVAEAIRPFLAGLDLDRTTVQMEWPDGNAEPASRVRVTVTTQHSPFITFIFGNPTWTLSSTSTMQIAH